MKSLISPSASRLHMRAERIPAFHGTAPDAKPRYQGLTTRLQEMDKQPGPWWFIAVVSERDAII